MIRPISFAPCFYVPWIVLCPAHGGWHVCAAERGPPTAAKYFSSADTLSVALHSKYGISLDDGVAAASLARAHRLGDVLEEGEEALVGSAGRVSGVNMLRSAGGFVKRPDEATWAPWHGDAVCQAESEQRDSRRICRPRAGDSQGQTVALGSPPRLKSVLKMKSGETVAAAQASPRRIRWNENSLEGGTALQPHLIAAFFCVTLWIAVLGPWFFVHNTSAWPPAPQMSVRCRCGVRRAGHVTNSSRECRASPPCPLLLMGQTWRKRRTRARRWSRCGRSG